MVQVQLLHLDTAELGHTQTMPAQHENDALIALRPRFVRADLHGASTSLAATQFLTFIMDFLQNIS